MLSRTSSGRSLTDSLPHQDRITEQPNAQLCAMGKRGPYTLLQEIGALTPAATAALAFLCMGTLEKKETYAALIPVMLGIMMATGYELSFNSFGFAAAVGGCLARALKTVLQVRIYSNCQYRLTMLA